MPEDNPARAEWLRRVLGVVVSGTQAPAESAARPGDLQARLAALEPRYQAALRAVPAERGGLVAAWEFAGEQARSGNAAAAASAIERLSTRIGALLAQPAAGDAQKFDIREGIVAERRGELEAYFAQQIGTAKLQAAGEIGRLTRALGEFIEEPETLVAAVRAALARLLDQLQTELDTTVAAGTEEDIGEIMAGWHERIQADRVVEALREACDELEVDISFDTVVETLMADIVRKLQFEPA